jgi:hypothetical protein
MRQGTCMQVFLDSDSATLQLCISVSVLPRSGFIVSLSQSQKQTKGPSASVPRPLVDLVCLVASTLKRFRWNSTFCVFSVSGCDAA